MTKPFVAWDGEGYTNATGDHIYNILANSRHRYILDNDGLSTRQCFEFFLANNLYTVINVIFGGSYDVNMILRDVTEQNLRTLYSTGTCYWDNYIIHWQNRKRFSVRHTGQKKEHAFVLWDVFGFFQKSFVKACRAWLGDLPILDTIQRMKIQRSSFTDEDVKSVLEYNASECELLVRIMTQLRLALDFAGIHVSRWDGAGAIAAGLLKKHSITSYKAMPPETIYHAAQFAYSGGRIEAPMVGNCEDGEIHRYDLRSAYPAVIANLPSLATARWEHEGFWNGNAMSFVEIEWSYQDERPFYPFFYRTHRGTIIYPRSGRGIYFGVELPKNTQTYKIVQAWNIDIRSNEKPFDFVHTDYRTRAILREHGHMAHEVIKLGLNSLYGKLAQQVGYRHGHMPSYHTLIWAGFITASTRAKLYEAASLCEGDVIAFATDAIITTAPVDLPIGTELGQWDHTELSGITIVQPGVYWVKEGDEWTAKYRGFDPGSLTREDVVRCWSEGKTKLETDLTRFFGIGSAIGRNTFQTCWRCWRTEPRSLNLMPSGKRVAWTLDKIEPVDYARGLVPTKAGINLTPDDLSSPYFISWSALPAQRYIKDLDEWGVDVDISQQELIDGYE
jgi:hypothetical protein